MEDLYALYVFVIGIPERDFWHLPLRSVQAIAEKKTAYERWQAAVEEKEAKRKNGRK